jgi:hypothetical protein
MILKDTVAADKFSCTPKRQNLIEITAGSRCWTA